jgi:hypothetical protein
MNSYNKNTKNTIYKALNSINFECNTKLCTQTLYITVLII